MKHQGDYIKLSDRISWGDLSLVHSLLNRNSEIDITYNDGEFFILAVDKKNSNIVDTLLDYFKNNQLSKYSVGSYEYSSLNQKMFDIIKTATEDVELSQEMEAVLNPYLPKEEEGYQEDCEDLFNTTQHSSAFHFEATGENVELPPIGDIDNYTDAHSN